MRKTNVYRFKGNFKSFLFIAAVVITLGFLFYTQALVTEQQQLSREFVNFKVKIFSQNINNEELVDFSFLFQNIIQTADYPMIYTDAQMTPQFWRNIGIPQNSGQPVQADTVELLHGLMDELQEINPPIPISYQGSILGYYFYGESAIIRKLRWLPVVEIVVVGMFILIGYAGFHYIKKSEERQIWVGMAKETAHQLGTPLTSQIGWLEYLKSSPASLQKAIPELEKDVRRLQVITNRFSQIGSMPELHPEQLPEVIDEITQYYRTRIPRRNSKTEIVTELDDACSVVKINRDLFSWVLENLIKNSLDAMENKTGTITIRTQRGNGHIFLDVSDTGKGIEKADKKNVFKPGYSTKKRGWGLGLSLAKRIVEEYHGGKLLLKDSQVGAGSTFRLILKA